MKIIKTIGHKQLLCPVRGNNSLQQAHKFYADQIFMTTLLEECGKNVGKETF